MPDLYEIFFFFFWMPDLYLYEIFKEQTVCMCVYVLGVLDKTLIFILDISPKNMFFV